MTFKKILQDAIRDSLFMGCVTECFDGENIVESHTVGHYGKDYLFDIASITKVLVGMATLSLVDRGVISLDDLVHKYTPFRKKGSIRRLRIIDLLTYTVFFKYSRELEKDGIHIKDIDGNFRVYKEVELEGEPGKIFRYGNPHAFFQGKVLEKILGIPIDQVLKELVFKPLGLSRTTFDPPHRFASVAPTVCVRGSGLNYFTPQDPMSQKFLPEKVGISGVFSNLEDMLTVAKFLATGTNHLGEYFVSRDLWKRMVTDQLKGIEFPDGHHRYGLGIDMPGNDYVSDSEFCEKAVFMSAASGPFIFACPEWSGGKEPRGIGGIVLCNTIGYDAQAKTKGRQFRRKLVMSFLEGIRK